MSKPAINIEDLSLEERIDLIDRLWESVAHAEPPLTADQRGELDRRLDELDREGPTGMSLDQLHARLRTLRR